MSSIKTESKDKMATRDGFGRALESLGEKYDFVVLCADLAESTRTMYFKNKFPDRYIECGIAEANMTSVAAGIATTGRPAITATYAMFAAGRAYEQIRNSVCYPKLNVKIGATHAGLSVGEDGATHQCLEDIALMRVLPGMTVISPCDGLEAKRAVEAALNIDGPVYIRLGRAATPIITSEDDEFTVGKGRIVKDGGNITVFATGILVNEAIGAANILEEKGINVNVINIHTIKPMDDELVRRFADSSNHIFTLEEHSVIGGLGSAVLESLAECKHPPVTRIGVNDTFGISGNVNELLDYFKLSAPHIADFIEVTLKK